MAWEWIKNHWDMLLIIAIAIGATALFGWLIFRQMPAPPGY